MPYERDTDVPKHVPAPLRRRWRRIWNNVYRRCTAKGGDAKTCEARAFASANAILSEDNAMHIQLIDQFNVADPGAAFRIVPVGSFKRLYREVTITDDTVEGMAANFAAGIPDNELPVTVDHRDDQGKVGVIAGVEARAGQGLYATVRWTRKGLELLRDGEYRYFSPEIFWGPTEWDGQVVSDLLMGLSLVHKPFFGSKTALYWLGEGPAPFEEAASGGDAQGGAPMEGNELISMGALERVLTFFGVKPAQTPAPTPVGAPETPAQKPEETEAFKLLQAKAKEQETEIARFKAEAEQARRLAAYAAYDVALGEGWAEKLARVAAHDEKLAGEIAARYTALLKQVEEGALLRGQGAAPNPNAGAAQADPAVAAFDAEIRKAMAAFKLDYRAAFDKIGKERPDLYKAYRAAVG